MTEDRPKPTAPAAPWPAGGSEMAGRIRTHDWASTALGPIENWPQSLRTIVDLILANPVANILVCGPRRVLIYNDACIRLYGDKHPRALGLEGPDAFPELWGEIGPLYDRVFAGEQLTFEAQPWAFERGMRGGDGLYDAWFTPGRGEDGEVAFAFVTAVEVTDGAHANEALRKSEERLGLAAEIGGVGHWELDLATGELSTSPLCRRNFGRPPDEPFTYDELLASIHPDDRDRQRRTVAAAIEARSAFELEYRLFTPAGEQRWIDIRARFEDGDAERLVGVSLDITERKRAEQALRESERRLAAEVSGSRRLQQLSTRLIPEQSPEALYDQILDTALELMRADAVSIQLLEDDGKRLRRVATRNLHPDSTEYWTWVDATHASTCGQALAKNERVMVEDVEASPELIGTGDLEAFRASGTRAVQSSPLLTRTGRPIGMISTHWRAPRRFEESDFGLFDILARQVADLFERSRTEARLRESAERQALLLAHSDAVRPLGDAAEIQAATTRLLVERLGVDRAMYAEVEGKPGAETGTIHGQYVRSPKQGEIALAPFPDRFTYADYGEHRMAARYRGDLLVVGDIEADPEADAAERANWKLAGVRAAVVAPLVKGGRLVAEFGLHCASPRTWTTAELSLVREIGERTWAAAERARAEIALRESEEKYRSVFESMDEGFCIWEAVQDAQERIVDFRFVEVNPAFERQTGLSDVVGRLISEVAPGTEAEWIETYGEVARTGAAKRFEMHHGDTGRWYDIYATRLHGPLSPRVSIVFRDVTGRRRSEEARRESEKRQAFLLKLSDAMRAEPDADATASLALRTLVETLRLDRCYIAEYRLGEDRGDIAYQVGNDRVPPLPESVRLSDFPQALDIAVGRTLVIDDVGEAEFLSDADKRNMQGLGMGALVTGAARKGENVPLFAIVAVSADPRDWTPGEIALIEEVNERTWVAIERARAEAALRGSEERQAFLLELSDALRPLADPAEIERAASRLLVEHLGANRAIYLEFEGTEETGVAVIRGQYARGVPPFPERISYLEYAKGFAVNLLEAHETIVVADTATDPRLEDNVRETWLSTDVAAVVATSLIKDGRMVANFGLQSAVAHEWTAAEIRLVEEVADRTWAAVERSRAEAALRESEERKAFLLALGDAMRSQSNTSGRIDAAARLLGERLGASRVLYAEFDHARGVADIFNGWLADGAQPFPEALPLEDHDGPIMDDLSAGRTVRIDDVGPLVDQPAYSAIAQIGVQALLSVPLVVKGELVVNLSVHQHEARHWTDDEVAIVQQVAERLWAEVVQARAEAKLRESEERYLALFESIDQGFCVIEMLFDDNGKPVDYRFLEVSPSFERQTGIADAAGRRMREIAPDHEDHWFRIYGEISLTGEPRRFENAARALGRWYDAYAYRVGEPEKRRVAILFNDITERRLAEAALRESEERFRGFAENSADVLWILNGETGQLEYLSPAFESIWGESRDAVMRDIRRWSELVHPDDREKASRAMPLLLEGQAYTAIYRIVRPDGEVRWIRDTGFPIHDDGITRAGGIAQDITDLQGVEARLATEEERSRLALNAGRLATWDWNLRENTVVWNDEHFRMQGYRVGEVEPSYEAWSARIHPEDLAKTHEALARARDEHGQYRHEFRNLLPDGSVTWCLAHGRFFYAPDGAPERMIGVMEDVTQRRMGEEALRESEARLQLIYDSLDEYAIITLDRKGFVTSWNAGAERLLGYDEEEAVGMDGRVIFTSEDLEQGAAEREIENALGKGRAANERWHVRKDGSRFWGSGAALPLRDGDGDGDGEPRLVKIMRDETARVQADEALRESESRLQLLLAELQHRVRNLLGMVRSLVRRSSHGYVDLEEFLAHLIGRLDALGRTQIMITRGIDARVDLETLVRDELAAQTEREELFDLEGPEVALSAKAAEVLSLALHELATNSLKYGVIGERKGSLDVSWWVTKRNGHDWLDLHWRESGSSTRPVRQRVGFGTELVEQRVPYELQGEGALEITAGGVEARISFPLADRASLLEAGAPRELR